MPKIIKCEVGTDQEVSDIVTVHKTCNRDHYAVGKRPVMNPEGPSYTYQGQDWICVGTGIITSVKINFQNLTKYAIIEIQ